MQTPLTFKFKALLGGWWQNVLTRPVLLPVYYYKEGPTAESAECLFFCGRLAGLHYHFRGTIVTWIGCGVRVVDTRQLSLRTYVVIVTTFGYTYSDDWGIDRYEGEQDILLLFESADNDITNHVVTSFALIQTICVGDVASLVGARRVMTCDQLTHFFI